MVEIVRALIDDGRFVRVFDPDVKLGHLVGANRRFIDHALPNLAALLCDDEETLAAHAEVLVIGAQTPWAHRAVSCAAPGCAIVDLSRASRAHTVAETDLFSRAASVKTR